jgi:hypothetical protein
VPAPSAGPRFPNLSSGRASPAVLDELFSDPVWMEKLVPGKEAEEAPAEPAREEE